MADPSPGIGRTAELARIARFGAVGLLSTAIYMGLFALVTM